MNRTEPFSPLSTLVLNIVMVLVTMVGMSLLLLWLVLATAALEWFEASVLFAMLDHPEVPVR